METNEPHLPLLVARWSHLSGCFRIFAPNIWGVAGTYE